MTFDIFLSNDFLSSFGISSFSTLVLNKKFALQCCNSNNISKSYLNENTRFRFSIDPDENLVLQKPKYIKTAESILIHREQYQNRTDKLHHGAFTEIQIRTVSVGSTEKIKILGQTFPICFVSIVSNDETHGVPHKDCDFGNLPILTPTKDDSLKVELTGNLTLLDEISELVLFKVNQTTKIKLMINNMQSGEKLAKNLYGLDKTEKLLVQRINHYIYGNRCDNYLFKDATGLLIYGLPGCGKRTLLEKIFSLYKSKNGLTTFILEQEMSLDRLKKLIRSITNKDEQILILVPNIELWFQNQTKSSTNEEQYENDYKLDSNSVLRLIETLNSVENQVMLIATASDDRIVLDNINLRKLFYKKHLIHLPNSEIRKMVLSKFVADSGYKISENDQISAVAANMHGYTIGDIRKVVRASLMWQSEYNHCSDFNLTEHLLKEVKNYQPFNLMNEISPVSTINWDDIGGYEDIKHIFKRRVQDRLIAISDPNSALAQMNAKLKLDAPRGILLHGPPGCSKTMFVRALATETRLPLIAVRSSRIFGRYVGDSERNIRRILLQARASAPSILFIDEIDLLLPSRNSNETGVSEHVLSEVLTAMDGIDTDDEVSMNQGRFILIGATNRLDKLDSALSRAGRFDLVLEIPAPDATARFNILRSELNKRLNHLDFDDEKLKYFVNNILQDYTGAECVQLVQLAAEISAESSQDTCEYAIKFEHLQRASKLNPPRTLREYKTKFLNLQNHPSQDEEISKKCVEILAGLTLRDDI